MYRISNTLLLAYDEEGNARTTTGDDDRLLEKLVKHDCRYILSGCLTNLPYIITEECHTYTMEKIKDRVYLVARMFGECKEILKLLESREVPDTG
ncbi:hypothetical protein LIER_39692 [Lithospermum erythrorhizon]|uniref:Uncharacterized protein n=1 Tax=Lithospermum erythrorhizon TaxID=34254 RepID=A0AAV3QJM9_LITER